MPERTEHGIPRAVAIAWGMHEAPQRGPSRGLSHERIVTAAIEIADAEGLSAVTMQRVAEALGFTTMSLYRYLASKDELLQLMQDAAAAPPKVDRWPPKGTWQDALRQWAHQLQEIYRRRPWILQIPRDLSGVLMPNAMAVADRGLAVLADLQIGEDEKVATILNVSLMTGAYVTLERELATGSEVLFEEPALELLAEVITAERLPHLAPIMLTGEWVGAPRQEHDPAAGDVNSEFTFGLDRLIEGLELLDARNRAG